MKKGFDIEEKVMKEIRNDIKLKRIPSKTNKVKPIFHICGKCKKNKVTNHHFKCNSCWIKDNKDKHNDKKRSNKEY
jgi:tRNA(Ile2) C34 agmatinyltransferase TiaS